MAQESGTKSAGGSTGPRARAEKSTESIVPARDKPDFSDRDDLEEVVFDADPTSETPQGQFAGGYHSIHSDGDQTIHTSHEADEADWDEGLHLDQIEPFENPRNLQAPDPRDGFHQCWVNFNEKDMRAMAKRGYQPRDPATIPARDRAFAMDKGTPSAYIESGGMVLMEIDQRRHAANMAAEREQAKRLRSASTEMLRDASAQGSRFGAAPIEASLKQTRS